MHPNESLGQFHHAYFQSYALDGPQSFMVFPLESGGPPASVPYNRRDFYQINLYTSGSTQLRYAGHTMEVESPALLLCNPLAPYACNAYTPLTGFCCLFTADFLTGPRGLAPWQETPLFQVGVKPVYLLTEEQQAFLVHLFRQLLAEAGSTYRYKLDLLRTHLQLLLHEVLRMQPEQAQLAGPTAGNRLAAQFLEALEQQFPVASPAQPLALRTAEAFAAHLAVHVNYLSRVLREVTGKTTSAHLAGRIAQEAQMLLRHSDWAIADVAEALGFADPTYFNHFFRKHAGTSPAVFRQQAA